MMIPLVRHFTTAFPIALILAGILYQGYKYSINRLLQQCESEPRDRKQMALWSASAVAFVAGGVVLVEWLNARATPLG